METAAWKSMGKVKGFSQFGCDEKSLRSTLGWRGAHWEVFLGLAGPVDWAGWKDSGCVLLLGKATCWQGVGGQDMGMSSSLMDVPSGRCKQWVGR